MAQSVHNPETIRWAIAGTTLGSMLVAASNKGVCRVAFGETGEELARCYPDAQLLEGGADFSDLVKRVIDMVERPGEGGDIPLDPVGTAFQQRVWQELRLVPAGETRTYAQMAAAVGKPAAYRAVGSAIGANPVAVLIPCHRVVRSDGSTGGYAWGMEIKQALLAREFAQTKE